HSPATVDRLADRVPTPGRTDNRRHGRGPPGPIAPDHAYTASRVGAVAAGRGDLGRPEPTAPPTRGTRHADSPVTPPCRRTARRSFPLAPHRSRTLEADGYTLPRTAPAGSGQLWRTRGQDLPRTLDRGVRRAAPRPAPHHRSHAGRPE